LLSALVEQPKNDRAVDTLVAIINTVLS